MTPKILVIGCGRSGTLYSTKVLKILGYDIGHEQMRPDGMASWFHSFGDRQTNLINAELSDHKLIIIHLVRNPIKVIESMALVSLHEIRYALGYFKDVCPKSAEDYTGLELAMNYWVYWNRMTERSNTVNLRIKVEDLSTKKGLTSLCEVLKIPYSFKDLSAIKSLGKKTHTLPSLDKKEILKNNPKFKTGLTINDLKIINPSLCKKVRQLAQTYGYYFY